MTERATLASTKAPSANASTCAMPRAPATTQTTSVSAPIHAGTSSRSRSVCALAARHGSAGPMPIRNSSARPIGAPSFTKYGSPTMSLPRDVTSTTVRTGSTTPTLPSVVWGTPTHHPLRA